MSVPIQVDPCVSLRDGCDRARCDGVRWPSLRYQQLGGRKMRQGWVEIQRLSVVTSYSLTGGGEY